jgi:hypothetical protein
MADLLTHALTFTKENVQEFFVDPFFQGVDIRDAITVRTDIKGTERLNRISRPNKITKKKTSAGFTPTGSMALTQTDLTVKPVAIEFEQNGRAFLDSVLQEALAKGWSEDDVNNMSNPDFFNQIVLPLLAEAGKQDLVRQMWFADEAKESLVAGISAGSADADYQVYTGFWTRWLNDIESSAFPSGQVVDINNGAVKQELIETLSGISAGSLTLTVNGTAYTQAFDTSATVTVTAWVASYASVIDARGALTGITVTDEGSGAVKFVAEHAGQGFTVVETDAGTGGTLTASGVVANVGHSALGTDEADNTFEAMIDAMPNELLSFSPVIMCSRTMLRNYIQTLKNTGTDSAHQTILNGVSVYTYEGIAVMQRPEWDTHISGDMNSVYPHRAVLTTQENLLMGTDGASDDESVETWWNQDLQLRRYRVQYKAQTMHLHNELIVLAR